MNNISISDKCELKKKRKDGKRESMKHEETKGRTDEKGSKRFRGGLIYDAGEIVTISRL